MQKQKESDKRMEAYKALCLGGLTSMYWKDTTSLLNKVRAISGPFASVLSEGFAISQAGMLIGIAASSFPKSSPWALAAASNGSLFAVLFNIAAFHLEIFEFLPAIVLLISWVLFSVAFAAYWCVGSQDLTVSYTIVLNLNWILCSDLLLEFLIEKKFLSKFDFVLIIVANAKHVCSDCQTAIQVSVHYRVLRAVHAQVCVLDTFFFVKLNLLGSYYPNRCFLAHY